MIPEAVEDAKKNAARNNISNAIFEAGKAEDVLPNLIARISPESKVAAILDPPRAGLRNFALFSKYINILPTIACYRSTMLSTASKDGKN